MPQTDSDLEKSFADIGFSQLKSEAPGLLDYLVGFQVLDKNDEDTHAVGIFGFHVGDEWIYAPLFYCQGELKGQDLLYVKNQDMFVPMAENWVTYLLNRKPLEYGEPSRVTRSQLAQTPPDFTSFAQNPGTWAKAASDNRCLVWRASNRQPWATAFFEKAAGDPEMLKQLGPKFPFKEVIHAMFKQASIRFDLPTFIKENGPTVNQAVIDFMTKRASVGERFFEFYKPEQLMVSHYSLPALTFSNRMDLEKRATGALGAVASGSTPVPVSAAPPAMAAKAPAAISKPTASRNTAAISTGMSKTAAVVDAGQSIPGLKVRSHVPNQSPRDDLDGRDTFKLLTSDIGRKSHEKQATDKQKFCEPEAQADQPVNDAQTRYWHKGKNTTPKDIKVLTLLDIGTPEAKEAGLTEEEKTRLLKGEVVIKDHRTNTSTVYAGDYTRCVSNPTQTGIYKMIARDTTDSTSAGIEDILVIHKPLTIGGGHITNVVTAVHLAKKSPINCPAKALSILENLTSPKDWVRYWAEQTPAEDMTEGQAYVILTASGQGSIPFKVLHKKVNADETTEYWVKPCCEIKRFHDYDRLNHTAGLYPKIQHKYDLGYIRDSDSEYDPNPNWWNNGRKIVVSQKTGGIVNVGDTLFVPANARAASVKWDRYGDDFPAPGTEADAYTFLMAANFVNAVKVFSHGADEYSITDKEQTTARMNKTACLKHLMIEHGVKASDAYGLVKEAQRNRGVRVLIEYPMIKAADGESGMPDWFQGGQTAADAVPEQMYGADPDSGVPTAQPQELTQLVESLRPHSGNRQLYNPNPKTDTDNAYKLTEQAANTGQKDIFDAGVVGGLLKTVDSDSLVDKYLGDLFLGMDRIGRILFLYYQHNQEFRERYGDDEMIELEDSLRNVFKSLGDLILFLKAKAIGSNPGNHPNEVDLTPSAS